MAQVCQAKGVNFEEQEFGEHLSKLLKDDRYKNNKQQREEQKEEQEKKEQKKQKKQQKKKKQ